MTIIESNVNFVEKDQHSVYVFLCNLNNHQFLMPKEVSEWWSEEEEAKLKVQGLGKLHLKVSQKLPEGYIKIIPIGATPVELFIEWYIQSHDTGSNVRVSIHADLNMFMRMVAEKPLKSLADYMASKVNSAMLENLK